MLVASAPLAVLKQPGVQLVLLELLPAAEAVILMPVVAVIVLPVGVG